MYINIHELIGDRATDMLQGDAIFKKVNEGFQNGEMVELDFEGMQTILSTFLNNAIGALYKDYSGEFLNNNLKISNLCEDDMFILKRVISRAKEYYAEPQKIEEALEDNF